MVAARNHHLRAALMRRAWGGRTTPLFWSLTMNTSSLSRYLIGGVAGVILATGIFDGPLSLVSAQQFFQPATNVRTDQFITIVNRAHKGDRLTASQPTTATTIIFKRESPALGEKTPGDPRLVPASLKECEPLASPFADPALGRFAARCFV
jgi:hypothetical protein